MCTMKILVLSDSHRTLKYMQSAVEQEQPDQVIHLGDHSSDAEKLERLYPTLPILSVRGNCDHSFTGREEVLTEFRGVRFLICHGHRYGVKNGLLSYELAARQALAQVALFGHTHRGYCEEYNGLWLLNPGTCGSVSNPSYGLIEIQNDKVQCSLHYFD